LRPHNIQDLRGDALESVARPSCFLARQWSGIREHIIVVHVVPDGENDAISAAHFSLSQSIELVLRPLFAEERRAQHDDSEPRVREAHINRARILSPS
jgi:hypothetical protein